MGYKRLAWIIESDECIFRQTRPTRKSADRYAQQMANKYNCTFFYYTNRSLQKAKRLNKQHKCYEVPPEDV